MSTASRGGPWWARRLLGPAVSVISLAAVVWWALHQPAPHWPSGAGSLMLIVLAVVVYAGVSGVRGVRWHAILRRAGIPASMVDAQALIVVGYMGNTVLPARGGELLRMFFLGRRTGCSRVTILGTILAERLLDVLALLVMLVVLLAIVTAGGVGSSWSPSDLALAAAAVGLAGALVLLGAWRMAHAGRFRGLSGRVVSLTLATRNLLSAQGLLLALLTIPIWLGEGFVYWLVGAALHLQLDFAQGCFLVVLSSLVAIIPAAPGYAGTYDAAIQLGLGALGVHGGRAISFGLLVRLVIFVPITVAGLVLVIVRYGGLSSLVRARDAATLGRRPSAHPLGAQVARADDPKVKAMVSA
jgi:glycosyltransferase 2 family protein